MASHKAHYAMGVSSGVIAASLVQHAGAAGPYYFWCLIALLAGIAGGNAPDYLEKAPIGKKRLWITHRTLTHWGIGWIGLLVYSFWMLESAWWAPAALGYAIGGVSHLCADAPNPLGIPWIYRRHSLKLWKSGRCDIIPVSASWILAFFTADYVFWNLTHTYWAIESLRSIPFCS